MLSKLRTFAAAALLGAALIVPASAARVEINGTALSPGQGWVEDGASRVTLLSLSQSAEYDLSWDGAAAALSGPGFTLTAALTGALFGLLLHQKRTPARIAAAAAVNQLVLSLMLNTLWISILYGSPYGPLFLTRSVQTLVMLPVQLVTLGVMARVLDRCGKRAAA